MGKNSFEQKKERLERLLGILKSEQFWTTVQLSQELSISHRTLMRDLAELRAQGIPIETERGRGGGVRLNQLYGVGRLNLSYQEIIDLLLALATLEKLKSPILMQNLKPIRDKLSLAFPESQRQTIRELRRRIYVGDSASEYILESYNQPRKKVITPLHKAFFEKKHLEIVYETPTKGKTTRKVEPHAFLLNWPVWYILAMDHLRGEMRVFRVDRIHTCKVLDDRFKLPTKVKLGNEMEKFFKNL